MQKINQIVFTETAKALEMVDATELKLDLENRRPNDPIGNLEESNPSENGSSMVHFVRPMAKTDVEGVLNVLRQVPEQDSVILPLQTTIGRLVAEWETFKALCH